MYAAWIALIDDPNLDESATYYFVTSTAMMATTGDSSLNKSAFTSSTAVT